MVTLSPAIHPVLILSYLLSLEWLYCYLLFVEWLHCHLPLSSAYIVSAVLYVLLVCVAHDDADAEPPCVVVKFNNA
jgi:hypothetical protein